MVRMATNTCLIVVMSIVLLLPVIDIDQVSVDQDGRSSKTTRTSFVDRVESDLKAVQTAASALSNAAVTGVRTLICLGETTVEVYRALNSPAVQGGKA
jgi:hypothetical protein